MDFTFVRYISFLLDSSVYFFSGWVDSKEAVLLVEQKQSAEPCLKSSHDRSAISTRQSSRSARKSAIKPIAITTCRSEISLLRRQTPSFHFRGMTLGPNEAAVRSGLHTAM